MHFKPSAGIFVAGLFTSILGSVVGTVGIGVVSSSRSYYDSGSAAGGGFAVFLGFLAAFVGLIMVYVGATRALRILDALPAALGFAVQGQGRYAPAHQQSVPQFQQPYPSQPYSPPQTPQHLVYKEPTNNQQPPVQ